MFIDYFDPGDVAVIIASLIAGFFSFITLLSSRRVSRKANFINHRIGELQVKTQDKQRIVETIGAQRIAWINNVREQFVKFNALAQNLHFNAARVNQDGILDQSNLDILKADTLELIKLINSIELYLNPKEMYSIFLLDRMKEMKDKASNLSTSIELYMSYSNMLTFAQNVILKSEWKRVKKETEDGEFLKPNEVLDIFDEVANDIDPVAHQLIKEEYSQLTS